LPDDRLAEFSRLDPQIFRPVVESGLWYARLRYDVDLRRASPAAAVRVSHTPILLIHGTADERTPVRRSRGLAWIGFALIRSPDDLPARNNSFVYRV